MAMRDLVPWSRGRDVSVRRGEDSPLLTLHREMNRLFDDVFRGFDLTPFGSDRFFDRAGGNWPSVEARDGTHFCGRCFPPFAFGLFPTEPKSTAHTYVAIIHPRQPVRLATAHARALRVFVLASVPATCATTPKRSDPMHAVLHQALIGQPPTLLSPHRPAIDSLSPLVTGRSSRRMSECAGGVRRCRPTQCAVQDP
jgi:hypothetical protein